MKKHMYLMRQFRHRYIYLFIAIMIFFNDFTYGRTARSLPVKSSNTNFQDGNDITINIRRTLSINNNWEFKTERDKSFTNVNLPHTWNAIDAIDGKNEYYRGKAIYTKTLEISKLQKKKVFLYFEGANQVADLSVNGDSIGQHLGGYSSFAFDISKSVKEGRNNIALNVTNQADENIPPLTMDFTFFGGIYRDVYMIITNPVHFDILNHGSNGVLITTPNVSASIGKVNISTRLLNENEKDRKVELIHRIISAQGVTIETIAKKVILKANSGVDEISLTGQVNSPELWSPDSPTLYNVVSEIKDIQTGEIIDQVVNPLGFRWFSMDAQKGFFLNGKHLKLVGVSKHQDFEGLGSAVPNELLIKDIEMIKSMGANCYRCSHYPPDPEVLAACDRLGILVSEEIPLVNSITETDAFTANCQQVLSEMIYRDFNHPSIFSWGLSNEICIMGKGRIGSESGNAYDKSLNKLITSLYLTAKSIDSGRVATQSIHYKTDRYKSSGVIDIGDYIGANLYMGWYFGVPDSLVLNAKKIQALSGNKPIVISEYGAGADPRLRSEHPRRFDFSLEYQSLVHKEWLKDIYNSDFISGSFIWNFADFNSPHRGDTNPLINNKGLVSYGRIPKDAFYFYQAVLSKNPVINIGMKNWNFHTGIESHPGYCSKKIEVFTNTKEAELFVNGSSLGRKEVKDYSVVWDVPMKNGKNLIEVSGVSSAGEIVKDYHVVNFNLIPSNLKRMQVGDEIRINAGSSVYFLDEEEKAVWMPDRDYSKESFGFIGGKYLITQNSRVEYREGVDVNIKGTSKDPLFQTQRIGTEAFKADVPVGQYEITFCLADLSVNANSSVYDLRTNDDVVKVNKSGEVDFGIAINGQELVSDLNPGKITGKQTAYEFSTIIYTEKELNINFTPKNGGIVGINGLKIRRMK